MTDCFISAIPGSGLGNETFPFQLLPASFPDSHVADTSKCVLRLLKQSIFVSSHCIPAPTGVNLAQMTWQGLHGVSKHPGSLAAGPAAGCLSHHAPPAAPLPRPCGCSGPSGPSLGCSLSIASALRSAGAWLQGFTPHFKSSQLSCGFHGSFLMCPGFDVCFP